MTYWMHITVQLPTEDGRKLLELLRQQLAFTEIDWCELQRPDFAQAAYGPCAPRTESGYTIAPFGATPGDFDSAF